MLLDTSLRVNIDDVALADLLDDEFSDVNTALDDAARSGFRLIDDVAAHRREVAGRDLRYLLVFLAARFGHASHATLSTAAVICELNHLATLRHDRIREAGEDATAEGTRQTNSVEILTGDFLFTAAARRATMLGIEAVELQARTAARLVTGQLREILGAEPDEDPVRHWLEVAADKTGALTSTCAGLGALVSGAERNVIDAMVTFGEQVGVAYRIAGELRGAARTRPDDRRWPPDGTLAAAHLLRLAPEPTTGAPASTPRHHLDALLRSDLDRQVTLAQETLGHTPDAPAKKPLAKLCESVLTLAAER